MTGYENKTKNVKLTLEGLPLWGSMKYQVVRQGGQFCPAGILEMIRYQKEWGNILA